MMLIIHPNGSGPPGVRVGWVGNRQPDPAILRRLRQIDPAADVHWVPGPFGSPPRWEIGVWWEPNRAQKALAVHALDRQAEMPAQKRNPGRIKFCRDVLRGWRPVCQVVKGQLDSRDVEDFRQRDWIFRHAFERALQAHMDRVDNRDKEREERIGKVARELAADRTLYGMLTKARKSIVTHGFKD